MKKPTRNAQYPDPVSTEGSEKSNSALINPWNRQQNFGNLAPETIVHTIEHSTSIDHFWPDCRPLLCDLAWIAESEINHFWLDVDDDSVTTIVQMPLQTYIDRHLKECDAMNPFYALERIKWLDRWRLHRKALAD
jgi:hypothetical protein